MNNKLTVGIVMAAWALLGAAQAAHAEDFNITIPLEISNLPPSIAGMLVFCSVMTGEPRLGGRYMGNLTKRVEMSGGGFRGNVTLNFNASAGQDPSLATHYECGGSFVGDERGATVHYFSESVSGSPRFPLAAGATFRLKTGIRPLPR
jgi:hypothetical protein